MELRAISQRLLIIGTLIIWTIKFMIRPFIHLDDALKFILGIAPNLLGSFLIPFGAYWLYTHTKFFNGSLLRFHFFSDARIVCLFGFSLLVINEYLQLVPIFGRTFDYFDMVFSAAGLFLSYYRFTFLQKKLSAIQEL
jgi:hypothetical protein